ncbi:CRYL1 [Cordylochernes scorpioides]|uniref:CRYL1 n=1 Tax=Cordylochernes scorpioides TaxID=51811 RepID=A0ABY6LI45_9ARAC|nr:CRYL1 [Cordylochernes scorpioides]
MQVNPPYYVPLVEIIPSPWTKKSIISKAMELQKEIGQKPVLMLKETLGFALNRIQYAIIAESWRLVEDGIMSAEDVDTVMTDGLGMRYAFLGPLETAHLNAEGMREYCQKYGQGIYNVLQTFGPNPRLEGPTAEAISQDLERRVPHDELQERRAWRDSCLAKLAKLKSNAQ